MIKIRKAKTEDALILCNAEIEITKTEGLMVSRPDELLIDKFIRKIQELSDLPNSLYIVAEKDNKILAHAMLDPMGLQAINHISRLTIAVHPGHEEQGIGEQLMKHLIDWAKSAPIIEKIELNVRGSNLRAIRLYQKLGFNFEGRIRNRIKKIDGTYIDDIEMGLFVKETPFSLPISGLAIGKVNSLRKEMIDDNWDNVQSYIELDASQFSNDTIQGLDQFSHLEVLFLMNQVDVRKIESSSRHPRNNTDWPKVGIFAQRGKNRPNQIGATICKILKIEANKIWLEGLDAIHETPVIDIKPVMKEFLPRDNVIQPEWSSELMKGYWDQRKSE